MITSSIITTINTIFPWLILFPNFLDKGYSKHAPWSTIKCLLPSYKICGRAKTNNFEKVTTILPGNFMLISVFLKIRFVFYLLGIKFWIIDFIVMYKVSFNHLLEIKTNKENNLVRYHREFEVHYLSFLIDTITVSKV